jgi:hypothetical protein
MMVMWGLIKSRVLTPSSVFFAHSSFFIQNYFPVLIPTCGTSGTKKHQISWHATGTFCLSHVRYTFILSNFALAGPQHRFPGYDVSSFNFDLVWVVSLFIRLCC